jgi:hypothetical protein
MSKNENLLTEAQVRQFMKLANLAPLTPGFVHGLHEAEEQPEWTETHGAGPTQTHKVRKGDPAHYINVDKKKSKAQLPPEQQAFFAQADKSISDLLSGEEEAHAGKAKQQESHGRGRGEGAAGYGHPNPGDNAGGRLREQELDDLEGAEADLGAAEDLELGAEEELDDAALDLEGDAGSMVSVDDFLAALEVALEDVLGDEVEVDQEEEEEEELEVPLGAAEELDVDVEEEELGLQERRGGRRPRRTNEGAALQGMVNTITRRVAKRIVREALKNKR